MKKKIFFNLLFILLFSTSCKISQKMNEPEPTSQVGNMIFRKEGPFIQSELTIGRRICAALKKKRELFQSFYDRQKQLRFQGTLFDCSGLKTLDTAFVASIANSSGLEYSSTTSRENYFRDVVTDQSIPINDICTSLSASDNVSNTVKSGSLKYTIGFLIANNYDVYEVKKELSNVKGGYTLSGAESVSIITQENQAPSSRFLGLEKERTRMVSCGNNKLQSMGQKLIEAVGDF